MDDKAPLLSLIQLNLTSNSYDYSSAAVFLAVFLLSLIASRLSIRIAKAVGLIDIPLRESHKTHRSATPIAGGLVISLTLLVMFGLAFIFGVYKIDQYVAGSFVIIFIVGIIDDLINLPAKIKLAAQLAVSLLLVSGGYYANVFDTQALNLMISIFWYVGIMNAFNFVDSADGLLLGFCIIIDSSIILATFFTNQPGLNFFAIGILGLLVSLYIHNKPPAKLFLGDSGSLFLGLLFALIALKFNPLGFDRTTSWITPILIMFFPIFDTTLVVFWRYRKHIPIFRASLDHTYHRLLKISNKEKLPNLIIFGIALFSNALAFINLYLQRIFAYSLFGLMIAAGILLIFTFENLSKHATVRSPKK